MSHRKSDLGIPCTRKICQSSASVLRFRSSQPRARYNDADFGIGTLARLEARQQLERVVALDGALIVRCEAPVRNAPVDLRAIAEGIVSAVEHPGRWTPSSATRRSGPACCPAPARNRIS